MKKIYISIVCAFILGGNLFAQIVTHDIDYVLADIDAYIDSTRSIESSDSAVQYVIVTNKTPEKKAILIFPVDIEKRDSVSLDLYWYVVNAATPINIDVMLGSDNIVDTTNLSTLNLSEFTRIFDKVSVPDKNKFTPFDVTESYNAAVDAAKSTITFLISVDPSDETDTELKFRTFRQKDGYITYAAQLALKRNCFWYEIAIDTILCEGTTLNIHEKTLTEDGIIVDTVTNECGSEDIYTYHAMFISSDPVTDTISICPGTSYGVQIGPRTFSTYTDAGTYIDTIKTDECQKIITTNLTLYEQPQEVDLGDDQKIKEAESYTLDAGSGYSSYKWKNDGKIISGEVSQQLVVKMSKDAFHTGINEVEVIVINENGCEAGSNVVWIDIKGNLFAPSQDDYAEEISDSFKGGTALRVKKDSDVPADSEPGYVPLWNRETFLTFDLSEEDITSDMSNYRLRIYLYGVSVGNGVKDVDGNIIAETPFYQTVACQFSVGGYDPTGNWASRPMDRTTLSAPVNIRIDSVEVGFIEWDINQAFVQEILNKNIDVFTVILSAPTDLNSHLTQFYSNEYKDISLRPAIIYDVSNATGNEYISLSEEEITLYPNPAKDRLYVQNTNPFSDYSIVDLTGRVIVSKSFNKNFIDVSTFKSGSYIISLKNDKYVVTKLFIKE